MLSVFCFMVHFHGISGILGKHPSFLSASFPISFQLIFVSFSNIFSRKFNFESSVRCFLVFCFFKISTFFFLAKMEVLILGCQATDSYKCMLLTTVLPTYGLTKLSNKTDPDAWLTGLSLVYRQPPAADPLLPGECKHDSKQSTSKTSQFCNKPFCFG